MIELCDIFSLDSPAKQQVLFVKQPFNRPRSIYQYSNVAPRLSGQISIFGVVFFVSKSLLGIEEQRKLEKFAILTLKSRSHARILIYRTWPGAVFVRFLALPNILRFTLGFFKVFRIAFRVKGGRGIFS